MLEFEVQQLIDSGNPENGFLKYYTYDFNGNQALEQRDYQDEMLKTVHSNQVSIIATARQMGKTVIIKKYIEWYSSLFANSRSLILSGNGSRFSAQTLVNTINPIVPCEVRLQNSHVVLQNQSVISVKFSSRDLLELRRNEFDIVWLDEPEHSDTFYALATNNPQTKIIVTGGSTRGFVNIYNHTNNVTKLKYPWDAHTRSDSYLPGIRAYMSEELFNEEMELGHLK